MKTPKVHEIQNLSTGSYIHFGIENMLLPVLERHNVQISISDHILKIGINIDGLPKAKSSKSQVWPILLSVLNFKEFRNKVFPIGIYHGFKKPPSIEEFLKPFISDITVVLCQGLLIKGTKFKVQISNIVCDAPAKAFLLNVKGHNAYFGCTSCTEEGTYLKHCVAFLGLDSPLRSDNTFRMNLDEDYHKGDSPLKLLPINITETVCLDYMHCVCLGVVKRLIEFWVHGNKDVRLTDENRLSINNELLILRSYIPSEFSRLPRSIDDIHYWKATELRNFAFYFSIIVLKGKIKTKLYSHFLILVFAIRILLCLNTCYEYNAIAVKFLRKFVIDYGVLYGQHYLSYNVHSLIHLPMFTKIHGPLDNFSSFQYENYLQEIKKTIKCAKYPLQEISNRIKEKQEISNLHTNHSHNLAPYVFIKEIKYNISNPFFDITAQLYEKLVLNYSNITINTVNEKDKCLMLIDNSLVFVEQIVKPSNQNPFLVVKKNLESKELTAKPISSIIVGIYIVNTNNISDMYCVKILDIKYKCLFVKLSNLSAVVINLCHTI